MPERSIEDRLREEYFDLLPQIRRVLEHLEAEIRYFLLPISRRLDRFERLQIHSRVKECESAVNSLRRRQEGSTFDADQTESYSLTKLKDLAGVRVLAFPVGRISEADSVLRERFSTWITDPVAAADGRTLALKYSGYCDQVSRVIPAEYQIASVLTGLFWEVEHAVIYKPTPELKKFVQIGTMAQRTEAVMDALTAFEQEFERLIQLNKAEPPEV